MICCTASLANPKGITFLQMDQLSKDGSGFVKAGYKGIQLPTHFSPCAPTTSGHSELPVETSTAKS